MPSATGALLVAATFLIARAELEMLGSSGFLGPAPPAQYDLNSLGPLKGLLGTWRGSLGLNVVKLPSVQEGAQGGRTASVVKLIQNYTETLTFTPILGSVLNRGYQDANQFDPAEMLNQTLLGVMYNTQIHELSPDGTPGKLIHAENGQWVLQVAPGILKEWTVGRYGVIPHGASVIAVGTNRTLGSGKAVLEAMDHVSASFDSFPSNTGEAPFGYGELVGFAADPVTKLKHDIGPDLASMHAVELNVTTSGGMGSIAMLRNIKAQVFNEAFRANFWIETVTDGSGSVKYQQLQYMQTVNMDFLAKFSPQCETRAASANPSCLIRWPHFQVNTLRKLEVLQDTSGSSGGLRLLR